MRSELLVSCRSGRRGRGAPAPPGNYAFARG
jgi:hypothetical protein